jgi:SAM-dependent methyltransferase
MKPHVAVKRLLSGFETRLLVRRVVNLPRDTFESLTGRRDPLIPPRGLWYVGGEENYRSINEEFLKYFVELAGLRPSDRVLDVGCGIGVTAARLTSFLDDHKGSYEGFDIVRIGTDWANAHIRSRFPNFRFTHADIFNKHYNPKGKLDPDTYVFPYDSASFDFVFLKSVFTHMRPAGVQHYLSEIRRVLKPTGRCLATAFLLNEESNQLIAANRSSLNLAYAMGGYSVLDPQFPETAVGLPEDDFQDWSGRANLKLDPPVHYGSWCGRSNYLSYQDIVILRSLEKSAEPQT